MAPKQALQSKFGELGSSMASALKKRSNSSRDDERSGSSRIRPGLSSSNSLDRLPSYYDNEMRNQQAHYTKPRAGPQRSTKALGKLKILPDADGSHAADRSNSNISTHSANGSQRGSGDEESSDDDDDQADQDELVERQAQLSQIPEGSMRRDARKLNRKGRLSLPRVTAYSTATSYRMRELTRWLQARKESHGTNPMTFDECIYSTYTYEMVDAAADIGSGKGHSYNDSRHYPQHQYYGTNGRDKYTNSPRLYGRTGDLLGIPELNDENEDGGEAKQSIDSINGSSTTAVDHLGDETEKDEDERQRQREQANEEARLREQQRRREEARLRRKERFVVRDITPEIFLMEYGTVVIWGMTEAEEKRFLRELRRFEVEKLPPEDVESEDLNWYLADYSRIYNDVITLRRGSSYMTKLSLSHALAQSTKISFFEGVIDNTIDATKDIPQSIAESGKIGMPPADIMKQIGHLFILRMNIHLVGSIVDSPEIFWSQPDLEPLYSAARSYLEIPQRIDLLNARVEVLQDMLQLLKDQVSSSHSEWLEIIVIVLIVLEIILGVATMIVDLYFA